MRQEHGRASVFTSFKLNTKRIKYHSREAAAVVNNTVNKLLTLTKLAF